MYMRQIQNIVSMNFWTHPQKVLKAHTWVLKCPWRWLEGHAFHHLKLMRWCRGSPDSWAGTSFFGLWRRMRPSSLRMMECLCSLSALVCTISDFTKAEGCGRQCFLWVLKSSHLRNIKLNPLNCCPCFPIDARLEAAVTIFVTWGRLLRWPSRAIRTS